MKLEALKDKFPAEDIEWRVSRSGIASTGKPWVLVLAYITNRAIMDRLDAVVGIENWQNQFKAGIVADSVLCGLGIRIDGEWIWKWDGAPNTQFEAVKGGLSDAMKRAGYQWGIGRYLYKLPETFGVISDKGSHRDNVKSKDGKSQWVRWDPPELPAWALPVEPKTTKNFKFLESLKPLKQKLGDEVYYKWLGIFGVEHANEITDRKQQTDLYKTLRAAVKEQANADNDTKADETE